jgi:hypothetical protein
MEGGSIEVNGAGCVLTTEQCLLNPNRNPQLSRAEIEQYTERVIWDVTKVLWLGEGIVGDDTDGHIDDIARFVAPNVIVCALEDDPQDANYEILQDNLARLRSMTDVAGKPFEIVTLPMPGVLLAAQHRHARSRSFAGQLRKLLHRQQRRAGPCVRSRQRCACCRNSPTTLPHSPVSSDQLRTARLGHGNDPLRHTTTAQVFRIRRI